ncbi:MAG: alkaline phosphatase family protein [Candidatus Omnitrophota bacterium]
MRIRNIIESKKKILLVLLAAVIVAVSTSFYFVNKKRYKIILIGLDAAGWNVILPLIEEGKLPNIKRLMDNGCWGNLKTLEGRTSWAIWTSIATGKSLQVHGITDFMGTDAATGEKVPYYSGSRKVKAIWNILGEYRKKVGIVGYLVTWPAERVNGVMISEGADESDFFSSNYSKPSFERLLSEREFNSFRKATDTAFILKGEDKWIIDRDYFVLGFSKYLLKKMKFDFFCLYIRGIDSLSHRYCRYVQDGTLGGLPCYKEVISGYYIWCDNAIGDLLKIAGKYATVVIVSDHGFKADCRAERVYFLSDLGNFLEMADLDELKYNSKAILLEDVSPRSPLPVRNIRISCDAGGEDFNAAREKAKDILKGIKIKETGKPIFRIIGDTNSGFMLEVVTDTPQYHILINNLEYKISDFLIENNFPGKHDYADAIIILSGKNIRRDMKLKRASIYDIAPTLLYLSGLPAADDMPGSVLERAIDLSYLTEHPLEHIDTYENVKEPKAPEPFCSPADVQRTKERMRSLGYLN